MRTYHVFRWVAYHAELINRRIELEAQLRSDAVAYDAWVEGLRIETTSTRDLAELQTRDDLLGELFRSVSRARTDPGFCAHLAATLTPLREKLPADVLLMFNTPLGDDDAFNAVIDDAERLLIAKVGE